VLLLIKCIFMQGREGGRAGWSTTGEERGGGFTFLFSGLILLEAGRRREGGRSKSNKVDI